MDKHNEFSSKLVVMIGTKTEQDSMLQLDETLVKSSRATEIEFDDKSFLTSWPIGKPSVTAQIRTVDF